MQAFQVGDLVKVLGQTLEVGKVWVENPGRCGDSKVTTYALHAVGTHLAYVVPEVWLVALTKGKK